MKDSAGAMRLEVHCIGRRIPPSQVSESSLCFGRVEGRAEVKVSAGARRLAVLCTKQIILPLSQTRCFIGKWYKTNVGGLCRPLPLKLHTFPFSVWHIKIFFVPVAGKWRFGFTLPTFNEGSFIELHLDTRGQTRSW